MPETPVGPMPPSLDPQAGLLDQAKQQYPILDSHSIGFKNNPGGGDGYMESWPPNETGTPDRPRPKEFPLNQFGVENYRPDSRPIDVLADVTSHYLIKSDPVVKNIYEVFSSSLQPFQENILKEQYQHAVTNEGEKRPYEDWKVNSGLPGYLRGYTFKQWPDDFNQKAYTLSQMKLLDGLMGYLTRPRQGNTK